GHRGTASCSFRCPRPRGSECPPWLGAPRGQREHECAPLAGLAVDPDPAAVQLDEPLRQCEAEACPLPLFDPCLCLLELFEDPLVILAGDRKSTRLNSSH